VVMLTNCYIDSRHFPRYFNMEEGYKFGLFGS
jgi:hypothetical protein